MEDESVKLGISEKKGGGEGMRKEGQCRVKMREGKLNALCFRCAVLCKGG